MVRVISSVGFLLLIASLKPLLNSSRRFALSLAFFILLACAGLLSLGGFGARQPVHHRLTAGC